MFICNNVNHSRLFEKSVGQTVTLSDIEDLLDEDNTALPELMKSASAVRDYGKGKVITYSPKVFIPLTKLCRDTCGYCTFRKEPGESNPYMSPEEVLCLAKSGEDLNCTEALFTLGELPEQKYVEAKQWLSERGYKSTIEYLIEMSRMVFEKTNLFPHSNPGTLSRRELKSLKTYNASMGLMLESISPKLHDKHGPHEYAPSKRPSVRIKTITLAGEEKIPFTTGLLIGIGDSFEEQIEGILKIKELNDKYGHIQEVIIQNFRPKTNTALNDRPPPEEEYMLRLVSIARLILGPKMNLQVPPNISVGKFGHYINAGINDWGGVSPITIDHVNPEAPWPQLKKLKLETERYGYKLEPRLPIYREYLNKPSEFVSGIMGDKLRNSYINLNET